MDVVEDPISGCTTIADGGIKFSGDLVKAIASADCACSAVCCRHRREFPGEGVLYQGRLQGVPWYGLARRYG